MIVTTQEAADLVGVEPATVRKWVQRGYLQAYRPDGKTMTFLAADVWRCHGRRRPKSLRERLLVSANGWRQIRTPEDELSQ